MLQQNGELSAPALGTALAQSVRRHPWLLFGTVFIAMATALIYLVATPEQFEASAEILVEPVPAYDETLTGIWVIRESTQSLGVLTVSRIVETPELAEEVRNRLNARASVRQLADSVETVPQEQNNVLSIVARGPTPSAAAMLANTFAEVMVATRKDQFQSQLAALIDRLEQRLDTISAGSEDSEEAIEIERRLARLAPFIGAGDPSIRLLSRAAPPRDAVWPRPLLALATALAGSVVLGTGVALAIEMGPRVTRERQLEDDHALPVLTRVPRLQKDELAAYLAGRDPLPAPAREAYRTLRVNLGALGLGGGFPRSILVTSATPGDGKTMTAVNFAVTLAHAGNRVCLVDGDLRGQRLTGLFHVDVSDGGVARFLVDETPPESCLRDIPGHGHRLVLLPAARSDVDLVDLLEPRAVSRGFARLADVVDVVVVDSPPLSEVADALIFAGSVDAVLLAIRLSHTRTEAIREVLTLFSRSGITPTGFVVTTHDSGSRHGYYYGVSGRERKSQSPQTSPD